jgi:hypothetical protein
MVDEAGQPRFGTYEGGFDRLAFDGLGGSHRLNLARRWVRQKRWHYTLVSTPEVAVLGAVVDLGYSANAFCCAVDLKAGEVLADESFLGPPGPWAKVGDRPNDGLDAKFRSLGASVAARGEGDRLALEVDVRASRARSGKPFVWRGSLEGQGSPPPLTVIAPTEDGGVNVTQKRGGLIASGTLEAGGRRYSLEGGVGGTDYTQGLLARRTTWRWAFGQGRLPDGSAFGLNLVEGFNEAGSETNENAVFLGGAVHPLGRPRFTFDRERYLSPWSVATDDGALELHFRPLHVHHELRDYKVIRSKFVQVVGLFEGTLTVGGQRHPISLLPGVTEDQDVLW